MVDCKDIAQTLLDCLKQTECMKSGGSAKECMAAADAPDCVDDLRFLVGAVAKLPGVSSDNLRLDAFIAEHFYGTGG